MLLEAVAVYWILALSGFLKLSGFALHLLLVAVFSFLINQIKKNTVRIDDNFVLVAGMLAFILPGYGMLGMFLLLFVMQNIDIQSPDYFEVDEEFLPSRNDFLIKDADKKIISIKRNELDIEAFKDIFISHDRQLQENAINKLSKIVNKQSVAILQNVVNTSTTDTKVMAASALIEMEDKIIKKIEKLQNAMQINSEDDDLRLQLARTYDLYCYLDVLDQAVKAHYQNLSLEQYRHFLANHPTHAAATLEYGRILLKSGQLEEAIENLTRAAELVPQNPNPHIWLAEAYYELSNYAAVSDVCERLLQLDKLPENLKAVVNWWCTQDVVYENETVKYRHCNLQN